MKQYLRIIIALLLVLASCQMFVGCDLPMDNEYEDDENRYTEEQLATVKDCFLVPRLITYDRFYEEILYPLLETFGETLYEPAKNVETQNIQRFLAYYMIYSKEKLDMTEDERYLFSGVYDNLIESDGIEYEKVLTDYPILDQYAVCVLFPHLGISELIALEEIIKTYCPNYTYEDLYYDCTLTEYDAANAWLKGSNDKYDYAYANGSKTCAVICVKTDDPTNIYIPREIDGYKVDSIDPLSLIDIESITFEGTMNEWWEMYERFPLPVHCSDGTIQSGQTKPE